MLSLSPCFFIFNIFNALSVRLLWNALIHVAFCIVTPFYIVCNSTEASLVPLSGSLGETNILGWKKEEGGNKILGKAGKERRLLPKASSQ